MILRNIREVENKIILGRNMNKTMSSDNERM